MKSRKVRDEIAAASKKIVLDILKKHPDGILSAEISKLTGLGYRHVARILISLRKKSAVFSHTIPGTANINVWTLVSGSAVMSKPKTVNRSITESTPCSNFDSEHEEWQKVVTAPKVKYNPWGRP